LEKETLKNMGESEEGKEEATCNLSVVGGFFGALLERLKTAY
jgi:hypothetical protein